MNNNKLLIIIIITSLIILSGLITKKFIEYFSDNYDNIDAFIYINLEDREDRKKLLLDDFKKLNIPENKINKISGVRIPKNGHKGCIQSHILALQMAKMNKWNTVAIFEDDAELTVDADIFKNMIIKAMNQDKWDMIILHGSNQSSKDIKIDDTEDIHYLKHSTQSTGYIIKSTYYDKLLNLFIHCNDMMSKDNWEVPGSWEGHALDQQWNKLVEKDNWIGFKNNLITQRNIGSSINT
jgi:GR25 family glycosyltransferase involved in LPS biosynthesis